MKINQDVKELRKIGSTRMCAYVLNRSAYISLKSSAIKAMVQFLRNYIRENNKDDKSCRFYNMKKPNGPLQFET